MQRGDDTGLTAFRERLAGARRTMQERLDVFPLAFSTDGRTFVYQSPLASEVTVGEFVRLQTSSGTSYLGHITSKEIETREGPEISVAGDERVLEGVDVGTVSQMTFRLPLRQLAGGGTVLGRFAGSALVPTERQDRFADASFEPATGEEVATYMRARLAGRATLKIGRIDQGDGAIPALLDASGFNRHTFLCGQSGSGKTYSLGVILERILLETNLRMVIIDPNSDFVRLRDLRPADPGNDASVRSMRERFTHLRAGVRVLRPVSQAASDEQALRIRFSELQRDEQGLVLRLDPLRDRGEYSALRSLIDQLGRDRYGIDDVRDAAARTFAAESRELGLRIANLGVADWEVWASGDQLSVLDKGSDWRALDLDIGGLATQAEKSVVAMATLEYFWRRRARRQPMLIVIDEAHNVCPAEPADSLQAAATEHAIRIAAEGRKFGLYLLLSSQRPDKLNRQVLSQCDNLVLMRMNSAEDIHNLTSAFSFVPPSLLAQATGFNQGESLIAGRIVPAPILARFGERITEEGGSDVPASWAAGPA
jgi:uncharacterized protein